MLIIPAIDIRGGKCVRLFQGDYARETVYGDDPAAMAEQWVAQGARFLHLVDLDGARDGAPRNRPAIEAVLEKVSVPVQVGGGIRDLATAGSYLSLGVHRVIVGTSAISDPDFFREACRRWPGRVVADVAARKGKAAGAGWTRDTDLPAIELARRCEEDGAAAVIYTDVERDGAAKGINLEETRQVARAVSIPVIASGGISTLQDLDALLPLEKDGVVAVIVGRALYAGTLKLPEAIVRARKL